MRYIGHWRSDWTKNFGKLTKANRITTPRHPIERTKEELYEASKDADIPEGREQVVKTLASVLLMENISDEIENLDTLSYALLWITQLKDLPKVAISVIRAVARAIDNVHDTAARYNKQTELNLGHPCVKDLILLMS